MANLMAEEDFFKLIEVKGEGFTLSDEQIKKADEDSLQQFDKIEEEALVARTYSLKAQKEIFITF